MDKKKQKSLVFTRKIRLVCLKKKLIFNHILTWKNHKNTLNIL